MTSKHWVSCVKFTVQVDTNEEGRIIIAAPIVRVFRGQPLTNLLTWCKQFGGVVHHDL